MALASRMRSIGYKLKQGALPISGNSVERVRMKRRRQISRKPPPTTWVQWVTLIAACLLATGTFLTGLKDAVGLFHTVPLVPF